MSSYEKVNKLIEEVEKVIDNPKTVSKGEKLYCGLDLGTAYTVLVVLNENKEPVACKMQFAKVIKDGLVVDFMGAKRIVAKLKEEIEEELGVELLNTALAVPPGTGLKDCDTHRYVAESAGFNVTDILDEPTSANAVLNIDNGVIVDIGGGTTGLSIFENGKVIYTADEATGGTHVTLVMAGSYKVDFDEAEKMKKDNSKHKEVLPVVAPVFRKVGTIVRNHIKDYAIDNIYLVGGTCCLGNMEEIVEKEVGIKCTKPLNPLLVTPLGIALNCK